ncbi:MAG: hypothetical protein FWF85_03010 [Clostridiales bacterium]|nr:hypothetical protein [Clostridiales bacterium]
MLKRKVFYAQIGLLLLISAAVFFSGCQAKRDYLGRLEQIRSEPLEIEKKWLIRESDIPYDLNNADKYLIEQSYINFSPEIRIRRINDGQFHILGVKANTSADGMVREEFETDISEDEYLKLLMKKEPDTLTIRKTRYQFFDEKIGEILAIDIFSNELAGLAYLEIEFADIKEAQKFGDPDWVISDVTDRKEYKNGNLAKYGMPPDVNR